MSCLERHRLSARALAEAFSAADARTVDKVAEALSALAPVTECGDREALARRVAAPPLAAREAVAGGRAEIARAQAVNLTGRPAQAVPLAAAAVEHARAVPYPLLTAEALQAQAVIEENAAHHEAAADIATRGLWAALAAGDDHLAARGGIELVRIYGDKLVRDKETRLWMGTTEALLARTGNREDLVAHYEWEAGDAEVSLHKQEAGLVHYQRALELCRKLGERHCEAKALQGIAEVKLIASEDGEARQALEKALALIEGQYGKDSPMLVSPLEQLGRIQSDVEEFTAATATLRRALALAEPRYGKEHPIIAQISRGLADAAWGEKRFDDALVYARRSAAVFAKTTGQDSPYVRQALLTEGGVLRDMKRYPEARATLGRVLEISEGEARIDPLLGLARTWLAERDPRRAEEPLGAGVALMEQHSRHDGTSATLWYALAKELWARRFAEKALKDFGDSAEHDGARAQVREWLTTHPAAAPR
jgi:tetratricopeptide (TPR) repeat protein